MKVIIRPASGADANAIALLNEEVQQLHAELEPTFFGADTSHGEVAAFFAAKLSAAGHNIRLAEIEGAGWLRLVRSAGSPGDVISRSGGSLVEPE